MNLYEIFPWVMMPAISAFWINTLIDSRQIEFSKDIFTDKLGGFFLLGFLFGLALGLAFIIRRRISGGN
jgi:hypothetical protein